MREEVLKTDKRYLLYYRTDKRWHSAAIEIGDWQYANASMLARDATRRIQGKEPEAFYLGISLEKEVYHEKFLFKNPRAIVTIISNLPGNIEVQGIDIEGLEEGAAAIADKLSLPLEEEVEKTD